MKPVGGEGAAAMTMPSRRQLAAGLMALPMLGLSGCGRLPNEDKLIRRFHKHRTDFDKLLRMALEERTVIRVSPDFINLVEDYNPTEANRLAAISDERWNSYRKLFEKLGLRSGISLELPQRVDFYAGAIGLSIGGTIRGYAWSKLPLGPIVQSLSTREKKTVLKASERKRYYEKFRIIDTYWYLVEIEED